ncbi:MAG: aminotransferase class I/II-fold pyridoxal phosphate-dependent enzyme [Acidimicrobiales bacterium]
MTGIDDPLRPVVPAPGSHGGDAWAVAEALGLDPTEVVDLSQTLNPFAADPAPIVGRHLDALARYPDPGHATAALAEAIGVAPDRLLLTNGGSEAIRLVAAELGGRPIAEPEFGLHPRLPDGPAWRSDPHNPTGALWESTGELDTAGPTVWDEAFYALATGRWTADRPEVTVGSLTKTFACPGLRLGYLIADDVDRFARHQPHWAVSSVALAALPDLLDTADLPGWQRSIASRRREVVDLLASVGLTATAADAPWVLVDAPGLRDRLAGDGVVVRDCASFGLPGVARVAVPDERGFGRLSAALAARW